MQRRKINVTFCKNLRKNIFKSNFSLAGLNEFNNTPLDIF